MAAMPASEFDEWVEYAQLHPFGDEYRERKEDARQAVMTSHIVNTMRQAWSKKPKLLPPQHFMPKWTDAKKSTGRQPQEVMLANREVLRAGFGKKRK